MSTEGSGSGIRRVLRGRGVRTAVVAGLVGALLGAGVTAWSTGALDREAEAAPCWGALREETLTALFGEQRLRSEEQELTRGLGELTYGTCRVTGQRKHGIGHQLTVRVHELDGLHGTDAHRWPGEFLTPDMTPLGKDLPGMASTERAWLALPPSCTGRLRGTDAATVVDLAVGRAGRVREGMRGTDAERRNALARAVVDTAGAVLRSFGCSASLPAPPGELGHATVEDRAPGAPLCGVEGLRPPAAYRAESSGGRVPLAWHRTNAADGPARVCDAGTHVWEPQVKLTTVTHPGLVSVFSASTLRGGTRVTGSRGFGSVSADRAAYRADCPSGPVVFLVEQIRNVDGHPYDLTAALLPGYVAAEAERIGCGPLRIRVGAEG
ncbi:hypothetical protein AB0E83_24495 [Streptomyces sp. NPDC035033]|uniref:hypothetical protein n=1 Tax=Streptomyces sp. NPDC035033 TaxID=3155368 RepID=UPI0033E60F1E